MSPTENKTMLRDESGRSQSGERNSAPLCLVTAVRLPVALRLVRLLLASGYRVIATDNILFTGCSAPRKDLSYVRLPNLRRGHKRWMNALIECCREHKVDFLLPVFEETYLVAANRDRIRTACPGIKIFAAEHETIEMLRDKRYLAELCLEAGVNAPRWHELTVNGLAAHQSAISWSRGCVLKPAVGYAGEGVILHPTAEQIQTEMLSRQGSVWMLQEFIPGETICLHAIASQGTILAMVLYRLQAVYGPSERGGVGFGCVFEPIADARVAEAAERIIKANNYSGHIGFDMIRNEEDVYCVDANPRATAGLHLLEFPAGWLERFWDGEELGANQASPCRDLTLLLSRAVWSPVELVKILSATANYRDTVHRLTDPTASLLVLLVYGYYLLGSWLVREHPGLLITRDIAYTTSTVQETADR